MSEVYRRKIQLVGGVTYSISLPKKWAQRNNLKDKNEVTLTEKSDGSLLVSRPGASDDKEIESFHLDIDHYKEDISQILFVLYYLGAERITIFSKKDITHSTRSKIKEVLRCMVGTEIVSEEPSRMTVAVLLDKSKVELPQIYYRASLLIESSIDSLLGSIDLDELERNEDEIDRLYHLMTKICLLAQTHTPVLLSSGIGNTHYLPSYLLIGKKLENMADSIYRLGIYLDENKQKAKGTAKYLSYIRERLSTGIRFLLNHEKKTFTKIEKKEIIALQEELRKLKDLHLITHLDDALRYLLDIEEELTNISFYTKLINEHML